MRTKAWLGTIFLSLLLIIACGQNQNDALLQELYVKSGMEKQMEQFPLVIQAGFDQAALQDNRLQRLPKNLTSAIRALALEAFAPESLKKAVVAELKEKLTVQDIKEVLKWLDSPLGKNCTRLEESAFTPEAMAEMQQYAAQIKNSPPTAERLDVLRKFDSAIKATESSVEIAINQQVAIALAITATLPLEQQRPLADIKREIEKTRPQVEAAIRLDTLISLLYTYRSLTESQIQQYIAFVTSPAGSKYQSVSTAAFKKALLDGSIKWGKAIGEAIKIVKPQSAA